MQAKRTQCGAALVEFALVASLLFLVLFGIIEFGLLFADRATLGLAAREAARSAALGTKIGDVRKRAVGSATGLSLTPANVTLEKSADSGATWTALGDAGTTNDATPKDLIRATVTYAHPLITGLIFTGTTKTLTAQAVMQREP